MDSALIRDKVKKLTPQQLNSLKQQLSSIPDAQKSDVYSQYAGIPELADVINSAPPSLKSITPTPTPTAQKPTTPEPVWKKALNVFNAPFQWVQNNISEPFAAAALSPITPTLPGGKKPGESWLGYEKRQYEAWQQPVLGHIGSYKIQPIKGAVEFLPWLAPTILSGGSSALGNLAYGSTDAFATALAEGSNVAKAIDIAGRVGQATSSLRGLSEEAGNLTGVAGKIASTAVKANPWYGAELLSDKALSIAGKAGNKIASKLSGSESELEKTIVSIAADQNVSPDFIKLHLNPARVKGLDQVSESVATKYLDQVADFSTDDYLKARMYKSFTKGDIGDATQVSESILNTYHVAQAGENWKDLNSVIPSQAAQLAPQGKPIGQGKVPTAKTIAKENTLGVKKALADIPEPNPAVDPTLNATKPLNPTLAEAVTPPIEPPKPPVDLNPPTPETPKIIRTSVFNPQGFTPDQSATLDKLYQMIKESKGFRESTETLYTEQRAAKISTYQKAIEKGQTTSNNPEQTLSKALGKMAGAMEQAPITPEFQTLRQELGQKDVSNIFDIVLQTGYKDEYQRINTFKAVQTLLLNGIPQMNQLKLLEKTFGSDLVKALLEKRTFGQKAGEFALDLLNAPRTLLASCDISGLLRQGGILTAAHPLEAAKTVEPMLKALLSDKNEALVDSIIRARPHFDQLVKNGLYIAPTVGTVATVINDREESFMSTLLNKVPFVKASNRAYVTGLNDLRSRVGEQALALWEKAGVKYTDSDIADLSQMINWATGRGTLPKAISQEGALLNGMFFAPKLILSRLEFPAAILPSVTKSALARKEATKTLLAAIGVGAGILTAARLSGAVKKLELDPRSADFGKLVVGDSHLDIWTGYAQYIRFMAQITSGETKTQSGVIQPANRQQIALRFAQTKLSPAAGLINDVLSGQTYMGESLPPANTSALGKQVYQRLMPLAIQDLVDGAVQSSWAGGVVNSSSFLGVGVTTYSNPTLKAEDTAAMKAAGVDWATLGKEQGVAAQLVLMQTDPSIIKAQKAQELQFANNPSVMSAWYKDGKSIEDTYRAAVTLASKEFQATGDGVTLRTKVQDAADVRNKMYGQRAAQPQYASIITQYNKPLTDAEKSTMNIGDVIRREYNAAMYSPTMYDQYGNYDYQMADTINQNFITKYGSAAMSYLDTYRGSTWVDKPAPLVQLDQAKEILRPYWQIADRVWSMYDPQLKTISDTIDVLAQTNPTAAKQATYKYPQILRAKTLILQYKKAYKEQSPAVAAAYKIYYG